MVVDRHPAIFGVTRRIVPLVSGVGHDVAELAVRQDLRDDVIEPYLEGVQDGNAVLLAEAANAVGLCFTVLRCLVSLLPFNPVELVEEPQRLFRRPAALFLALKLSTKRRWECAMHPI
jgi:hypothetical protein